VVALVALPGTLCPVEVYDALARELAGEVEVRPYDWLSGPGPWDVPVLAARLADTLDEPVHLAGHSTGGAIALQAAVDHPDAVAGLLLVDTGAHMQGHGDVDAFLRRVEDDWGDELREAVLDRSFRHPLEPSTRERWLAWAATVSQQAVRDVLASQRDLDLRPHLGEVRCPVTVVHGRHDRARPVSFAEELVRLLPEADLRLADTGHSPQHEAPELVAEAVRDLVRR
jgi:3-oxoadipate enol-lactonase